jgi:hypothetical protein
MEWALAPERELAPEQAVVAVADSAREWAPG